MQIRIILNKAMGKLTLIPPSVNKDKVYTRPGFKSNATRFVEKYIAQPTFEPPPHLVYEAAKLSHSGICAYKVFENCNRSLKRSSLSNLLSSTVHGSDTLSWLIDQYKACVSDFDRELINKQAASMLDQDSFDKFLTFTRQARHINASQSRKIRQMSEKLAFYSAVRKFESKRSGKFKFKVAFLTLTTPETATPEQALKAFDVMLDYLARTANCRYVWKKELGDQNHHLHFHVLINNFIPYYLIDWKWKRALLSQGVLWPKNQDGKDSSSHYRIELPRSRKQVAHYIAKYMSKCYDMPAKYGYLAGWSRVLSSLKEAVIYTGDKAHDEVRLIVSSAKRIARDFVSFFIVDFLSVKDKFPQVGTIFEQQYMEWSAILTLPQRFSVV